MDEEPGTNVLSGVDCMYSCDEVEAERRSCFCVVRIHVSAAFRGVEALAYSKLGHCAVVLRHASYVDTVATIDVVHAHTYSC